MDGFLLSPLIGSEKGLKMVDSAGQSSEQIMRWQASSVNKHAIVPQETLEVSGKLEAYLET